MQAVLKVVDIHKHYEGQSLLRGVSFEVKAWRDTLPFGFFRQWKEHIAAYNCRFGNG